MTVYNLGSINADLVYRVPHLPGPGETVASLSFSRGLGGKGANMSVAVARAGAHVVHIGAVGADGAWATQRLLEYGVDTRAIAVADAPTGHAIIAVDEAGENSILIHPGANRAISEADITRALKPARSGDILLFQNETNAGRFAAETAKRAGMRVVYAAAPFEAEAVDAVLDRIDMLVLNQIEAAQLEAARGMALADLGIGDIVVTLGAEGCRWFSKGADAPRHFPAFPAKPVDTTGAGDTFTGYLVAGLDRGMPMAQAIGMAQRAAAIMVTRAGAADVIPDLKDLEDARFAEPS